MPWMFNQMNAVSLQKVVEFEHDETLTEPIILQQQDLERDKNSPTNKTVRSMDKTLSYVNVMFLPK